MTTGKTLRAVAAAVLAGAGLGLMRSFGSFHLPSVLAYSGIVIVCAGIVTIFLPKSWSGFSHRVSGLVAGMVIGGALFAAGWFWPARTLRVAVPATRLDAVMPIYDFHERHEILIPSPVDRVHQAISRISLADIGVMDTLARVRSIAMGQFRAPQPKGTPLSMPMLEMMHDPRSMFFPLDEIPNESVFGMVGAPWRNYAVHLQANQFPSWKEPETVKIAFNFLLEDIGNGRTRAITETRVMANDEAARRKMAHYWALIYPGTAMVRVRLLEAIRLRAEQLP